MERFDGRLANTLRPLSCELSCLENADGSCLWKSGATQVLAAVHGPIAPRQAQHEAETATVSVVIKSGVENMVTGEWEGFLTHMLSASICAADYPRCTIQVVLQIISADGSVLGAALHAAVSSLMDAGIAMQSLPVAVTCLLTREENTTVDAPSTTGNSKSIQLDPSADEENAVGAGIVVLVSDSTNPLKILGCQTAGISMNTDTLLQCCSVTEKACPAVTAFWRLAMEQKATRESKTLWSS
jgi:ribonuclease PH